MPRYVALWQALADMHMMYVPQFPELLHMVTTFSIARCLVACQYRLGGYIPLYQTALL
jgi:hypothetical protein